VTVNDNQNKIEVVTVFLKHEGRILILKRSQKVRTMKGKWAGISGYLEGNDPYMQALKEIEEETGLRQNEIKLAQIGVPLEAIESNQPSVIWVVRAYLFISNTPLVRIDWEHDEYRWILPEDLENYETVPMLKEALGRVLHKM
jgi:8-oxo-dGTP pyrophosphatase MutT (NUDIX family)